MSPNWSKNLRRLNYAPRIGINTISIKLHFNIVFFLLLSVFGQINTLLAVKIWYQIAKMNIWLYLWECCVKLLLISIFWQFPSVPSSAPAPTTQIRTVTERRTSVDAVLLSHVRNYCPVWFGLVWTNVIYPKITCLNAFVSHSRTDKVTESEFRSPF